MNRAISSFRLLNILAATAIFLSCNDQKKNEVQGNGLTKDSLRNKESLNPYATHDQSPMDMSYYPIDYPVLRMNGTDSTALVARVIYSRPQKNGRSIFGYSEKTLIPYGKEWRLGANEATELEFFKPVEIDGKKIDKGRYIIYCIPYPDKWTIVLNRNLYTWGLHMDATKNIFTADVPTKIQSPELEDFTMVFERSAPGVNLVIAWDNVKILLPISIVK